jgi:hypothetical protein
MYSISVVAFDMIQVRDPFGFSEATFLNLICGAYELQCNWQPLHSTGVTPSYVKDARREALHILRRAIQSDEGVLAYKLPLGLINVPSEIVTRGRFSMDATIHPSIREDSEFMHFLKNFFRDTLREEPAMRLSPLQALEKLHELQRLRLEYLEETADEDQRQHFQKNLKRSHQRHHSHHNHFAAKVIDASLSNDFIPIYVCGGVFFFLALSYAICFLSPSSWLNPEAQWWPKQLRVPRFKLFEAAAAAVPVPAASSSSTMNCCGGDHNGGTAAGPSSS